MAEGPEVAGRRAAGVGDDDVVGGGLCVAELRRSFKRLLAALECGDVGGFR